MNEARKQRLAEFVAWVGQHITGDEKGEAQVFLDRLFLAFGQRGIREAGATLEMRVKRADTKSTAFADLVWKPVVLIEMKKRGEDLSQHYRQAFDYWTRLVPGRPRFAVLCNFDEFWVYDFETQMDTPVDQVKLADLPERYGPLAFLFPTNEQPTFGNDFEAVTRAAADKLATCFKKLTSRKVERNLAQRFILQLLVALFAEDIDLLEKYMVIRLLEDCKKPTDSYDLLGGLFEAMNTPGSTAGGRFKGVDYFNGGLFAEPARVELHSDELNQLKEAAKSDWSKVRPEIFGTLFEQSLGDDERHAFGAHFTSPVDIMKIVGPTIVAPWRELIDSARTPKRLLELRQRMHEYTVLDPACGSGNFLYIAYRELKRLEARIVERLNEMARTKSDSTQTAWGFVTARQFYGIDINPFAVELAKVTMMIARKFAIDELHVAERALPLDNLDDNFFATDALVHLSPGDTAGAEQAAFPAKWPQADVIIGNPPFLDARKMTLEHGRHSVELLRRLYPEVPRRADYCTYWFRKAHDHLPLCVPDDPVRGRAGLVGTQNIRNNQSRVGGLDYIVKTGVIVEAVDNQPWSGEANVHVSIANWVKVAPADPPGSSSAAKHPTALFIPAKKRLWHKVNAPAGAKKAPRKRGTGPANKEYELAYNECRQINSALSDQVDVSQAIVLQCNRQPKHCFEGIQPGHNGFRLSLSERNSLIQTEKARAVIFPYLNGDEMLGATQLTAPRFLIDFGERDLLEASKYPKTLQVVRNKVLPEWQENATSEASATGKCSGEHQNRFQTWWLLKRPRRELVRAIRRIDRFVVCARVTKRPVFSFLSSEFRPDSSLTCFAFADDYSFGVLQSSAHWLWFITKCSKLTERFRYTPESVFDTFPWPQAPTNKQVDAVAKAACEVRRVRDEALAKMKGGLRAVYRTLELPGKNPLKDAHAALDAAVLDAYRFSPKKDLLAQLLDLNLSVAARIDAGEPVVAPGVPPTYPDHARLVTDDAIRPKE